MPITDDARRDLLADLLADPRDPLALAEKHHLTLDQLARWIDEPRNHRTLAALCLLADFQVQLLLARYRLSAAGRLIALACDAEATASADVARRACVDLLKLDLAERPRDDADGDDDTKDDDTDLRAVLYGRGGD